jgi:hypothetical protein
LEWSRSEEPLSDRGNTYTIDKNFSTTKEYLVSIFLRLYVV